MEALQTPLGVISFSVDGTPVEVNIKKVPPDEVLCPSLEGRFFVEIDFSPDGKEHSVSCRFKPTDPVKCYPESGEWLECWAYYNDDESIKLSIGLRASTGYIYDNSGKLQRVDDTFDYDGECQQISDIWENYYAILPITKSTHFPFGIAWIFNPNEEERDVQTWFGADPSCM